MSELLKVKGEVMLREIAGEYILIPLGETALRLTGMICVTESGAFLWKLLQEGCTFEDLVDALLKEYDVSKETAAADVEEFLGYLKKLELL